MRKTAVLLFLMVGLVALPLMAQEPLREIVFTTGGEAGTYHRIFNEIRSVCNTPPLRELSSKGSVMNIDRLLSNEAAVGIAQEDVLVAKKVIENDPEVDSIRTLLVLYPEDVHFLVKTEANNLRFFSDLGNKRVVSWGGSIVTGKVIQAKTGVRFFQYLETDNETQAIELLRKNSADAILAVGGQPLGWIKALQGGFRLLPFDRPDHVRDVYVPTALNYVNLNQSGVRTISTKSMLITNNYRTIEMVQPISDLRKCIVSKLDVLRETTGTHPAWRRINPEEKGFWPMFEGMKATTPPVQNLPQRKPGVPIPPQR